MKKFANLKKYISRKLSSPTKTGGVGKSSSDDLNEHNTSSACKNFDNTNSTSVLIAKPEPYWVMLITANVGTVFEYTDEESETWFEQLRLCVAKRKPMFVALHFQEMGGKRFASIRSAAPAEQVILASPAVTGKASQQPHHHRTPSTAVLSSSNNTDHSLLTKSASNASLPANMSDARLDAANANYELISKFTARLVHKFGLSGYDPALVLVDSEFDNQNSFTALGNYYFLRVADAPDPHASLSMPSPNVPSGCLLPPFALSIWNFHTHSFEQVACANTSVVAENQLVPDTEDNQTPGSNSAQLLGTRQVSDTENEFRWLNTTPSEMFRCRQYYEKVRFSPSFFTHSRWSRKGFMRTRWRLSNGIELDLCNVHLFHNVSNIESMQSTPSIYAQSRSRALYYVLSRIYSSYTDRNYQRLQTQNLSTSSTASPLPSTSENAELDQFIQRINNSEVEDLSFPANVLVAIFGDFNFRIDLKYLLDELSKTTPPYAVRPEMPPQPPAIVSSPAHERERAVIVSRNEIDILKIGSKIFSFLPHNAGDTTDTLRQLFRAPNAYSIYDDTAEQSVSSALPDLKRFDTELEHFKKFLFEYERRFGPTYPLSEAIDRPHEYLGNRPPSWCDRVFFGVSSLNTLIFRDEPKLDAAWPQHLARHRQSAPALPSYSNRSHDNSTRPSSTTTAPEEMHLLTPEYSVIGRDVCMGDHKPVFLHLPLMAAFTDGDGINAAPGCATPTKSAVIV